MAGCCRPDEEIAFPVQLNWRILSSVVPFSGLCCFGWPHSAHHSRRRPGAQRHLHGAAHRRSQSSRTGLLTLKPMTCLFSWERVDSLDGREILYCFHHYEFGAKLSSITIRCYSSVCLDFAYLHVSSRLNLSTYHCLVIYSQFCMVVERE